MWESRDGFMHCCRLFEKKWKHKGLGFFHIPKITVQGEEPEELTTRRRNEWISAFSRGDAANKRVLESELVCSKHFVFREPAFQLSPLEGRNM